MKKLLFLAEKINCEGNSEGAFDTFGWSGEASYHIYEIMENIFKIDMVSGPLRLKPAGRAGRKKIAQDLSSLRV